MLTIGIVTLLLYCSLFIDCLPQPNSKLEDHQKFHQNGDKSMTQKRQDISELLLEGEKFEGSSGGDELVSVDNLMDWSSATKLRLTPSIKQSLSSDPFGLFKQKIKQVTDSTSLSSSSPSSSAADQLKAALNGGDFEGDGEENWIKAYTGPAIGGLASFNGADYDEGSPLKDTRLTVNKGGDESSPSEHDKKGGKGKKSKAWWAKFFDRQRGNISDHPSDPVNYGINPHGRYPTTDINVKPQAGGNENDENRPINNMRKWLTRLWKPNGDGAVSVTGTRITNQQDN